MLDSSSCKHVNHAQGFFTHLRAAKGVGQKVSAAFESLKMGWGGGMKRSPSSDSAASPVDTEHPQSEHSVSKVQRLSVTAGESSPQRAGAQLRRQQTDGGNSPDIASVAEAAAAAIEHDSCTAAGSRPQCKAHPQQHPGTTGRSSFEDDASRMEALGGATGSGPKRPEMLYPAGAIHSLLMQLHARLSVQYNLIKLAFAAISDCNWNLWKVMFMLFAGLG